jgi:phosphoglycerate kinase
MYKTLKDFNVAGKRILVRCDFNVPVDDRGNILDDFRIKQTLPTIKYLIENKAKIILMSHLGDPKGQVIPALKLDKVAERLAEYLKISIEKSDDCVGPSVESDVNDLKPGSVLLSENLRFHKEEEAGDLEFAKKLSFLGDVYVNDAFGVCHRPHASVAGVPQFLPHCAGLLLEKEIIALDKVLGKSPSAGSGQAEKPMVAVIGGTKVETKSAFIDRISEVADYVIISGLIKKEVEEKKIQFKYPEKILGPLDSLDSLDIDQKTTDIFCEKIATAKTILWNGPFGKFEDKKYAKGTLAIAKAIIKSKAFSVVGGGETIEFLAKQGMIDKFSHVSTGGGAMLSYLSGENLPGLEALQGPSLQ